MKLSIVVPCFNEAENILLILEKFKCAIHDEDIEVILVNNGSTDQTVEIMQRLLPNYKFARTVFVPVNQGYGYGILQGLKVAEGEFVGWTHADMQTDPADVLKAYGILEKNHWDSNLFVKGARIGRPLFDRFFTYGMNVFESIYLREQLYEINAQPNIFSKEFLGVWENPPADFALDLYVLYMAKVRKMKVERFDVCFPSRLHGKSHWNTGLVAKWKFIKRTIEFSINLKRGGIC